MKKRNVIGLKRIIHWLLYIPTLLFCVMIILVSVIEMFTMIFVPDQYMNGVPEQGASTGGQCPDRLRLVAVRSCGLLAWFCATGASILSPWTPVGMQ